MKTPKGDTPVMTEITRNEMKDTLSAIENRMDKRIDRMEQAELQRYEWAAREHEAYRREQEARDRLYSERFEATNRLMDAKLDAINASFEQVSSKVDGFSNTLAGFSTTIAGFSTILPELLKEVKSSNRNTVLATLAIGVATVLGLWGANSTIIGSAGSIFQSGYEQAANAQDVKNLMEEVKAGSDETKALLEAIRAQRS
ncbi:hypothetical protein [Pseudomonas avellanae]|uniref:Uncharacterized protein n=1 Tax=Pseudomonas avellanae TaxID=46257 RepID=A0A3M5U8M7_9PSED|nr:hypothetical protein [Pseudomonas avellanae]RMU41904.1 hypothetical protein ALP32_101057 [Pseudomonas avellanae]UQW69208.1 hypothetical protein L2Y00_01205 [Pseudomonas avellanae]UQW72769.1 hypothetical protein L2Y01_18440 [Pseudomonas avellanae]